MLTVPQITCDHVSDERRSDHFSVDYYDSSGEQASRRRGRTCGSAPRAGGGLGGPRGRSLLPPSPDARPRSKAERGPRMEARPAFRPRCKAGPSKGLAAPWRDPLLFCSRRQACPGHAVWLAPRHRQGLAHMCRCPASGPGNRVQRLRRRLLPWRPSLLDLSWTPPEGSGSCEDSVTISGTPEGDKLILFLTL